MANLWSFRRLSSPVWRHARFRRLTSSCRRNAQVRVVEVGPRDGLQNESRTIALETKLQLIERLSRTGLRSIEAGAFVSPKWVPQMAHSAQILKYLAEHALLNANDISYSFLVPNIIGLETALSIAPPLDSNTGPKTPESAASAEPKPSSPASSFATLQEISIFTAATETFSQRNTNCSVAESLQRFKPVIALAKSRNIRVRGYISVVLGCPYEGPNVSPHKVAELSATMIGLGVDEISLGDTTGMGTAPRTLRLLQALDEAGLDREKLAVHFHDTYGQALVNSAVALENGIRIFDSSVAGLGGCPYADGATGNVATEDLVYFLHSLGMDTGVDVEQVAEVGSWISTELKRDNGSRVGKAMSRKRR